MSSNEVAIIAILYPNQDKLQRVREFLAQTVAWIKANEPETLEFSIYEEQPEDGGGEIRMFISERYASPEALQAHESSANYAKVFQTMTEESLLSGAPTIVKGLPLAVARR